MACQTLKVQDLACQILKKSKFGNFRFGLLSTEIVRSGNSLFGLPNIEGSSFSYLSLLFLDILCIYYVYLQC